MAGKVQDLGAAKNKGLQILDLNIIFWISFVHKLA